jgi:hypothetical protein
MSRPHHPSSLPTSSLFPLPYRVGLFWRRGLVESRLDRWLKDRNHGPSRKSPALLKSVKTYYKHTLLTTGSHNAYFPP